MLDRAALSALGVDESTVALRERLDGVDAHAFLAALPALVARWQDRFGLHGARLLGGGALSAAFACVRLVDAAPVVLKLSAPHAPGVGAEAAALAAWGGEGACALLDAAADGEALLLERIEPGTPASAADDASDARAAAALLGTLHAVPPPSAVPTWQLEGDWRFERARTWVATGRAVAAVTLAELDEAGRTARELHDSGSRVLCHGDFLDKNLLLDGARGLRAIDPMPCVSDRSRDAAFWALHHQPGVYVGERCELVARAAGLDGARVRRWALAFAATEAALDIAPGAAQRHLGFLRAARSGGAARSPARRLDPRPQ